MKYRTALSLMACFAAVTAAAQTRESATAPAPSKKLHQFVQSENASRAAESKQSPHAPTPAPVAGVALGGTLPSEPSNPALPSAIDLALMDPPTRAKYFESLQSYYDYHRWGLGLRQRTFEWQLLSSRIIFVAVLALVGVGLYFAWVQFRADMLRVARTRTQATSEEREELRAIALPAVTEFSAGKEGLRVSSPVLGVIILAISLVFFYLYLAFVYPISQVF